MNSLYMSIGVIPFHSRRLHGSQRGFQVVGEGLPVMN